MAEKNISRILILKDILCSGRMAQWYKSSLFALEEVGVQVLTCFRLFSLLTLFTSREIAITYF